MVYLPAGGGAKKQHQLFVVGWPITPPIGAPLVINHITLLNLFSAIQKGVVQGVPVCSYKWIA